jgi:hypothetical protein
MPNGGIPINMLLRPRKSRDVVIYCHLQFVEIFRADDWPKRYEAEARPLITLDSDEGAALAGFLRYWIGEPAGEPVHAGRGINVEYDY